MVKKINLTKNKIKALILVIIFSCSASIIPVQARADKVIIGGESFGLKLYCKGVMITQLESFESGGARVCPAEEAGLKVNDVITKVGSRKIKSNEALSELIQSSGGEPLNLTVLRNEKEISAELTPKLSSGGDYLAGMWIKDSCAGLGTISYYNPEDKSYGALGHGIRDADSGGLIKSDNGELLSAEITSVTKSDNSRIGTLNGYFTSYEIGTVTSNSEIGLYGKYTTAPEKSEIEIAENSEVHAGEALMYSTVKGTTPKAYKIRIIRINNTSKQSNKNFTVRVTDESLLEETGGIVQGMSGSPIVQDGKFAGALTHVFVHDCAAGYGVLAKNMVTA